MSSYPYQAWRFPDEASAASEWRRLTARLARNDPPLAVSIVRALHQIYDGPQAGQKIWVLVAHGDDAHRVVARGGAIPYDGISQAGADNLGRRRAAAEERKAIAGNHQIERHRLGEVVVPDDKLEIRIRLEDRDDSPPPASS